MLFVEKSSGSSHRLIKKCARKGRKKLMEPNTLNLIRRRVKLYKVPLCSEKTHSKFSYSSTFSAVVKRWECDMHKNVEALWHTPHQNYSEMLFKILLVVRFFLLDGSKLQRSQMSVDTGRPNVICPPMWLSAAWLVVNPVVTAMISVMMIKAPGTLIHTMHTHTHTELGRLTANQSHSPLRERH